MLQGWFWPLIRLNEPLNFKILKEQTAEVFNCCLKGAEQKMNQELEILKQVSRGLPMLKHSESISESETEYGSLNQTSESTQF